MKKILSLFVVFTVMACTRSMPSSFYTLATTPSYKNINIKNKMRIGIYVTIPKYIERPQIVTKKDEVEMDISEYHRWIEPVSDNIGQTVSENIMDRTKKITILPINTNRKNVDYVVNIDVKKFEGELNGSANLTVFWSILGGDDKIIVSKTSTYSDNVLDNYNDLVKKYSVLVGKMTDEILTGLEKL